MRRKTSAIDFLDMEVCLYHCARSVKRQTARDSAGVAVKRVVILTRRRPSIDWPLTNERGREASSRDTKTSK